MLRTPIVIDTLGKMVENGLFYYAMCRRCRYCAELDMAALIERLGPEYPAAGSDLGNRLRCQECKHLGADPFVGNAAARRASGGYPAFHKLAPAEDLGQEACRHLLDPALEG